MFARFLCLLIFPSVLMAQLPEDHFEVAIKFDQGRFVTNRTTARLNLSDAYRAALRPSLTDKQLIAELCDALDREFRLMPKPYYFTLTDAQKVQERLGQLHDPQIAIRRIWNGSIETFPGLEVLNLDRSNPDNFNAQLEKVRDHSPIAEYVDQDRLLNQPVRFRLRRPLAVSSLETPQLGTVLKRGQVLKRLAPINGLPADPEKIQSMLLDFYTTRGLTPKIVLALEATPPSLSIFETARIARILLPKELTAGQTALAEKIVYESLPDRVFRAFRLRSTQILGEPVADPDATKREVDLRALVIGAEDVSRTGTFMLPPMDSAQLALIQQRLLLLMHQAALFDFRPEELLFDLVIDATTPQEGAAAESNLITGTAETPPNAPKTSSRPGAAADLQVSPVAPAATSNPGTSADTPRREKKNFLGGGIEYNPGQGIRAFGSLQRRDVFGADLLSVESGGQGSGFTNVHYARDYVFFPALGRRLSLDIDGGTDYTRQRILDGVLTNERRSGGAVRLDLEFFRDRNSHRLGVFAEARHETVRLTAAQPESAPRAETAANLNTIDIGAQHEWRRQLAHRPLHLRIEPWVRFGLGWSASEDSFRRFQLSVVYHQSLSGPLEFESRLQARIASTATPVFELPSLGGADSVRGFRSDESLARRLWAVQNEIWCPVMRGGAPSKFRDFVRRDVRLAWLYDLGGTELPADGLPVSPSGFRHGTGLGLRVKYQGVVLEVDWAYGFGSEGEGRAGRGRFYFNVRLP